MTDNIYKPTTLTKAVKRIDNKNTGLLGLVFKRQAEHLTETISTDIDESLYNTVALFNNGKPANGRLPIRFKQKIF